MTCSLSHLSHLQSLQWLLKLQISANTSRHISPPATSVLPCLAIFPSSMPSFSFLKSSKRGSQQLELNGQASQEPSGSDDHELTATEKAQRRKSTREFFRALIKKPAESDESRPSRWRNSSMVCLIQYANFPQSHCF